MSANSRMTIAVHVLTWIALVHGRGRDVVTSDQIATSVATNPVVIRRSLADLRKAGLVTVRQGAGAGYTLARAPESIALLDVFQAVHDEPLFALHRSEPNQVCPVGRGIQPALRHVYTDAEEAFRRELAGVSIADVLRDTLAPGSG
ncbi:putative HTH-type transcriptional regulator YwnA [Streptomyces ambofaciens ATCC 23877]|uniref:Putative HTH-type transcriptional regulator YwnA n=1 Tax=Streptomyces ambofaciens (strain ATCC 23877 / 3486 / DSM 40053 / JCM 4204 / NBRC 12836 / NRRL B-2516) TaxID=278992 RepID=A0ABZ8_STRA7|nr:Rrf2 family transcriptional regulator [Streptomyces ambofaciens]AKZ60363.1 putative HTH-type transcriptional regulator YwnA [Streptomyces ambofaciens ATCC 23877]CAJ88001.1 putative transcriptional regulator [Streptomyces ambofaciens ATCC 23877]